MGLAIEVGILADLITADPEGEQYYREVFGHVNELLEKNGLRAHHEPEKLPRMDNRCEVCSNPYSFLHYLRRVYAHRVVDPKWIAAPLPKGMNPTADPVVEEQTMQMDSHLLCHSDAEGFYLPIDFKTVLCDEKGHIPGALVGSSHRLMDELIDVAPALGIQLKGRELPDSEAAKLNAENNEENGIFRERLVWFSLFEAARLSIKHNAAICFT